MKNIFFILLLILVSSCGNDDDNTSKNPIDQLPPATQTGENTFGFLVNGKPVSITNSSKMTAIYQGGLLQFSSSTDAYNMDESIAFNLINPLNENQIYFFDNISYRAGYSVTINKLICIYESDDTYQGSITFTKIDTENFIISGTFEFSTVTEDCEDVKITNGRFDMWYIP